MSFKFFTSYANLDEMINIGLLAHQIGLGTAGTARQWLLDPTHRVTHVHFLSLAKMSIPTFIDIEVPDQVT